SATSRRREPGHRPGAELRFGRAGRDRRRLMKASDGYPVRLRFTKHGKVRFISHRDVARGFERAFRIEQLPLAFTLGFAPRRKGRQSTDDIRPVIRSIDLTQYDGVPALALTLSTHSRGARPREVLDAISADGVALNERRVLRTAQWIERDGARLQPLEADALA